MVVRLDQKEISLEAYVRESLARISLKLQLALDKPDGGLEVAYVQVKRLSLTLKRFAMALRFRRNQQCEALLHLQADLVMPFVS